jgi:hypothetical protein
MSDERESRVWAIIEMVIAGYLDEEALSFVDCQPRLD